MKDSTGWRKATRRRHAGFTLVELLAVIIIIAVVSALIIGTAAYASRRADTSRAEADLERIKQGLEEFRIHYGSLPVVDRVSYSDVNGAWDWNYYRNDVYNWSSSTLEATVDSGTGVVHYLWYYPQINDNLPPFLHVPNLTDTNKVIGFKDPWDRSYQYYHGDGENTVYSGYAPLSRFSYELWSFGPILREGSTRYYTEDDLTNWRGDF